MRIFRKQKRRADTFSTKHRAVKHSNRRLTLDLQTEADNTRRLRTEVQEVGTKVTAIETELEKFRRHNTYLESVVGCDNVNFFRCRICFNVMERVLVGENCGHAYCSECIARLA